MILYAPYISESALDFWASHGFHANPRWSFLGRHDDVPISGGEMGYKRPKAPGILVQKDHKNQFMSILPLALVTIYVQKL